METVDRTDNLWLMISSGFMKLSGSVTTFSRAYQDHDWKSNPAAPKSSKGLWRICESMGELLGFTNERFMKVKQIHRITSLVLSCIRQEWMLSRTRQNVGG